MPRFYSLLLLVLGLSLRENLAAGFYTNAAERILANRAFAETLRVAAAKGIACAGIDPFSDSETIHQGDAVTVLATLTQKGEPSHQWLLYTEVTGAPSTNEHGAMVIYNNFGHKFEFPSTPTPVSLRTIGPFLRHADELSGGNPPTHDDAARFDLDKGYLGLGLDRATAASIRVQHSARVHGPFRNGTAPFSPEEIESSKKLEADWKFSQAEERALAGSYPALLSYFNVVQHTKGLFEIARNVIDRPSIFSLAANLGIRSIGFAWQPQRVSPTPPSAWGLGSGVVLYELPLILMLNDHPSLNITMIVAAPRPPLLTSAGIVGLLAEHPRKPGSSLTLRVISARIAQQPPKVSSTPGLRGQAEPRP